MRSSRGWPKTSSGVPCSTIAPKAHFVSHHHHGHASRCEVAHHVQYLVDQLGIERGRRLVEQDHFRLHGHRSCNRDALLLTAGQLRGSLADVLRQVDLFERQRGARASRVARQTEHALWSSRDIVQRAQVREQVEALKHETEAAALPRELGFWQRTATRRRTDALPAKADRAAVRRFQIVDTAQQRRLARPRRPDQHHRLPVPDLERDRWQDDLVVEALVQAVDGQERRGRGLALVPDRCGSLVGAGDGGHVEKNTHGVRIAVDAARGSATATPAPRSTRSSRERSAWPA